MHGTNMGKGDAVVFLEDYKLSLGNWHYAEIKKGTKATVVDTTYGWAPWNNDWKHELCNLMIPSADPTWPDRVYKQIQMSFVCCDNPMDRMIEAMTREGRLTPLEKAARALDEEITKRVAAEKKARCGRRAQISD
jgi:hypothetical protein